MRLDEFTKGEIVRVVNTRKGPALKVRGMSALLGPGDIVSLEDGRMLEIRKIGPGKKIQLEDGKFYALSQIKWDM